jgi:hypothetical protein
MGSARSEERASAEYHTSIRSIAVERNRLRTSENHARDADDPQLTANSIGETLSADRVDPATVRAHLERILLSTPFRNSKRYPALLRYVVEQELNGASSELKERTIAIEVFGRDPSYDPGADPVVRISAGEVRKRLAQYYQEATAPDQLRIELPVGSYRPEFVTAIPAPPGFISVAIPVTCTTCSASCAGSSCGDRIARQTQPKHGGRIHFGVISSLGGLNLALLRDQADRARSILASRDPAKSLGYAMPRS